MSNEKKKIMFYIDFARPTTVMDKATLVGNTKNTMSNK